MTLTCCCCNQATKGKQWFNRDKGYGLCKKCWDWIAETQSGEEMRSSYGIKGIHCGIN